MATRTTVRAPAAWRRTTAGELLSELLGTFVLICFGDGVVAMAVAALNQSGRGTEIFAASGDWLIIGWGWGFRGRVRRLRRRRHQRRAHQPGGHAGVRGATATRSTPHAISGRACSRASPAGARSRSPATTAT
jgi:hypothetical protein